MEGIRLSALSNGIKNVVQFQSHDSSSYHCYFHHQPDKNEAQFTFITDLTWGYVSPWLYELLDSYKELLPDVILGADCFFDETLFDSVLNTVSLLLKSKKNADCSSTPIFLCTYQNRNSWWNISEKLFKFGLSCSYIPLQSFCTLDEKLISKSDNVQMLSITLSDSCKSNKQSCW